MRKRRSSGHGSGSLSSGFSDGLAGDRRDMGRRPPNPARRRKAITAVLVVGLGCAAGGACAATQHVWTAGSSDSTLVNEVASALVTASSSTTASDSTAPPTNATTTVAPAAVLPASTQATVQGVVDSTVARFGGEAAVAISNGTTTVSAGNLSVPAAWSTIKVPIAIAALRENDSAHTQQLVHSGIVNSDNDAARSLFSQLGDANTAAAKVDAILAEGGNGSIHTQPRVVRPGFTNFGQTMWPIPDAAAFAAHLPCIAGSDLVQSDMQNIGNGGGYGLDTLPNVGFKGGWGPDEAGRYLVRQMGFLQLSDGSTVGIAIAAHPSAGTYAAGQSALTALATGIKDLLPTATGRQCG